MPVTVARFLQKQPRCRCCASALVHLTYYTVEQQVSKASLTVLSCAVMQVASYPWGPVVTAISEAVALASCNPTAPGTGPCNQPDLASNGCEEHEGARQLLPLEQYQQLHEQQRASLLGQQQQRWWREVKQFRKDQQHGLKLCAAGGKVQQQGLKAQL